MLQLTDLNDAARGRLPAPRGWHDMAELERLADERLAALREARTRVAGERGGWARIREAVDRRLLTDALEVLDRPDVSDARKVAAVRALDRLNRLLLNYHRFLSALEPLLRRVVEREGRPARVLELACGAGAFTLECAELARRRGIPVEITGTDIVEAYVHRGNTEAWRRGRAARFEVLNAFDMSRLPEGGWDVAFIGQSLHHFSAGQMAMMIAQSRRVCTDGFVAVDGHRSLMLLTTIPVYALLAGPLDFAHDALLSTRKFYPMPELAEIARVAAPDAAVSVRESFPGYSFLTVDWGR